jgi:alcohol dehydrogenase class IV
VSQPTTPHRQRRLIMLNFTFYSATQIVFGRGTVRRLGELAAGLGSVALTVYNGGPPDRATALLEAAGVKAVPLRQRGEPTVTDVNAAVLAARQAGCNMVVGIGGGSAIDAAKAVAGLMTNGGDVTDYMEVVGKGQKITRPAAPWIAIPTTAGTGAEVTRNAVIGHPEKRFKASLRSEHLLPRVALVDPELGASAPPEVTASSGSDALCQLIESYTSVNAQPITDALALAGIPLAARSLRRAVADGGDLAAREDMALAALLSGITLTNVGLGAVHGFASPLGGNFPAPHGTICGLLLPHVISANVFSARARPDDDPAAQRTLDRYAVIGRALAGNSALADADAVETVVRYTADLARDLKLPLLGQFGLTPSRVPEMVALARTSSSMRSNPLVLSEAELRGALTATI